MMPSVSGSVVAVLMFVLMDAAAADIACAHVDSGTAAAT